MTPSTRQWTTQRNLSGTKITRETLIYILGRVSRGETLPPDVLVLLAEHPQMWVPHSSEDH